MPEEDRETILLRGKEVQVGVKLMLFNPDGNFLIIKRNPEKYPGLGEKWDIPGGRMFPKEETVWDGGKREVRNETGLEITENEKPVFIGKQKFPQKPGGPEVTRLTYKARATGDVKLSDEHTEYRWVTIEEAKQMQDLDPYLKVLLDEPEIAK
jgi:ADP-ribose pyrophosphatase YjhB (NUDIX family)